MKWDEFLGRVLRGGLRRAAPPRVQGRVRAPARGSAGQAAGGAPLRIFKNNLLALPWIREGEELRAALEGARADLLRSRHAYRESLRTRRATARSEADWRRVTDDFRRQVADLNRRIAAYNLKAPSQVFRRSPVDAEREIGRILRDE